MQSKSCELTVLGQHYRQLVADGYLGASMTSDDIDEVLNSLIERLAAIEHERWSHWQRYVHETGRRRPDGSLLLPGACVALGAADVNALYRTID
jgi:hypothetical protein